MALRVRKENPLLSPGSALREQEKAVAAEGMKGMDNGKGLSPIHATGCS